MKKLNQQFMYEMAEEVTPESNPETNPEAPKDNVENPETPQDNKEPEETPENPPAKEDNSEEVKGLQSEIERLQGELKAKSDLETKLSELQGKFDQLNKDTTIKDKVAEYEGVINDIINSKLEAIPEKLKELVPGNLSVKEKLDWLNRVEAEISVKTGH